MKIATAEKMQQLGLEIGKQLRAGDLVLLNGELGAGKTTLTRGIGQALGAVGTVQSPTFVLARTHKTQAGPKLVHVDAYRLSSPVELDDLDIDFENSIVIVEWARDFLSGYVDEYLVVSIRRSSEDEIRTVEIISHGERWKGIQIAAGD